MSLLSRLIASSRAPLRLSNLSYFSHLSYTEHGHPPEVISIQDGAEKATLYSNDVAIKMLMAPINPSDINSIQGKYPITPPLPAVGGSEGVGEVTSVGSSTSNLRVGDLVIPSGNMVGTWSEELSGSESDFIKMPSDIPLPLLATLRVNPCTAYRMLMDFVDLKEGDVVVQNGANSHCGQSAIQIAKALGARTVNIVRQRDDIADLKAELLDLGADYVLTEDELRKRDSPFRSKKLPPARLALNCVGGDSSAALIQCLGQNGVHVTYGGMSLKPVITPTAALIFKDVKVRGFWMSRWTEVNKASPARLAMFDAICDLASAGKFRAPRHVLVGMEEHERVLEAAMKGFKGTKYIFDMRK